jgi:hypothetical protein
VSLQGEILDALGLPGWTESVTSVKTVVRNAIQGMDRTATIEDTGYFNHSFVPDFRLSWASGSQPRDVYLRMDTSEAFLLGDLKYLRPDRPLLLGLATLETEEPMAPALQDVGGGVMLTEPAAIERLSDARQGAEFGQVVPGALLRGGHGLVDESTASSLSTAASRFFGSARMHEVEPIASAIPVLERHLNESQGERVIRLGRILWEATGGEPTRFPGATDLGGVDDDGLAIILEEASTQDSSFWREVGRSVSLERLLALPIRSGGNFEALVRANADRLFARCLLVRAGALTLAYGGPAWSNESGGLVLRGADFTAYISPTRKNLHVDPDSARSLDLPSFRERTADEVVERVEVVDEAGKRVHIEDANAINTKTDAVLASVGVLPGMRVASVGLAVSGRSLRCDFESRTATTHTSASLDVTTLLRHALPILWDLTDPADQAEIDGLVVGDAMDDAGAPLSLFEWASEVTDDE